MKSLKCKLFFFFSSVMFLTCSVANATPGYAISSPTYIGEWRGYGGSPIKIKIDSASCSGKSGFNNLCACSEWFISIDAHITEQVANRMASFALSALMGGKNIEIFGNSEGCRVQTLSVINST